MNKQCKLYVLDEVNVKFKGLDAETTKKCMSKLKFFSPTAKYSPMYKLGRWDGCYYFFSSSGSTQINLLDKILPIVEEKYDIELIDNRLVRNFKFNKIDENYWKDKGKKWPERHKLEGEYIELTEDQVNAVNYAINNLQSIQSLSTGFGKTMSTATLSNMVEKYGRTLVIVPNKSLVKQTYNDYINVGLDVGRYYGDIKELNKTHTICTWQSLDSLIRSKNSDVLESILENLIAVIVDECHQAKADVLKKLLCGIFSNIPIRWGLTGTIPKLEVEYLSIFASIGPIVNTVTANELQEKNYLASCSIKIKQLEDNVLYSTYDQEKKYLLEDENRVDWISNFISQVSNTGNTLILVPSINLGKKLNELVPNSKFIYGKVKVDDREVSFNEINDQNNLNLIATYNVASTGISINRLFNLVLIEPGKSFVRVIQSIGRGLRKAKDKNHVNIFDLCSTAKFSRRHLNQRIVYYKEAKYQYEKQKVLWNINKID